MKPLDTIAPLTPRNTPNTIILQKQMEKLLLMTEQRDKADNIVDQLYN